MRFELDEMLIDDISFCMENQNGDFLLDTQEGCVVDIYNNDYDKDTDFEDEDRFIGLPEWSPSEGYRLMERFANNLKKPVLREELARALNRNRGVFRAFRDVLEQYPETLKQWFSFKDREMKNEVIAWYNSLREEWGLEPIGCEPEDNTSLVLEDFVIKEAGSDQWLTESDTLSKNSDLREKKNDFCLIAETAGEVHAGIISAEISGDCLIINILEVKPEFRGMGIGKTLLEKAAEKADREKLEVIIDLPVESDFFSRTLYLESFKPCMQRFVRKI